MSRDPPLTVTEVAELWSVHRNTARRRLLEIHRQLGDRYVWRVGKRGDLRTTRKRLRAAGAVAQFDDDALVTKDQFFKAIGELWREVRALRAASGAAPLCTPLHTGSRYSRV